MNERPKETSADFSFKASIAAIVVYAFGMGLTALYWALQCGPHWFMYTISFSLFAVLPMVVVYAGVYAIVSRYASGRMRYWIIAGGISIVFFIGCFVAAHLQPATPFYLATDCVPF